MRIIAVHSASSGTRFPIMAACMLDLSMNRRLYGIVKVHGIII